MQLWNITSMLYIIKSSLLYFNQKFTFVVSYFQNKYSFCISEKDFMLIGELEGSWNQQLPIPKQPISMKYEHVLANGVKRHRPELSMSEYHARKLWEQNVI